MNKVETKQIKVIHALLSKINRANDKEFKKELVNSFSNWRVDSTKGLFYNEAAALIHSLQETINRSTKPEDAICNQKRRLILHYAHMMNWYKGGFVTVSTDTMNIQWENSGLPELDIGRVNGWCMQYGKFHKPLNDHTSAELSKLIVQFEKVYQSYLKSV